MSRALIYLVAGARPNFMKIAPIVRALRARADRFEFKIVHTGQHYDREMSDVFFDELGIPKPNYHLEAGGGSHATQTAKIVVAFEEICQTARPDCVLVVGDVNSTLACSIVAKKQLIPVAHVEAGLRSGDMRMPEEINRLVTDSISDWFFCTEPSGVDNLLREGKSQDVVFHVGHVMVDNLLYQASKLTHINLEESEISKFKLDRTLSKQHYGVITLHRPSNVDDREVFSRIGKALKEISTHLPLIFPTHPRTRENIKKFGIDLGSNITLVGPQAYMPFLDLWKNAAVVLTDSGGLQEETTALGIPCITIRENTERPITVDEGTNTLVGTNPERIIQEVDNILQGKGKQGHRPQLWDGHAAERIVEILEKKLLQRV